MGSALLGNVILFAQGPAQDGGWGGWVSILTLWAPILLIFWFLLIRPQQREQGKRRQMLEALKKNDRILTAGGVYGVVTNIHREADEVTIKVDETTNTKLRVTLASIARVLGEETPEKPAS